MVKVLELVVWVLVGLFVLAKPSEPRKLEYGLCWICLLIHVIAEMVR